VFDPATETEPGWDAEVGEGVAEECAKFGTVLHVHVDAQNPQGVVHIMFREGGASHSAVSALAGAKFSGRIVGAAPVSLAEYLALFPEAALKLV
jgi:RNA-binding protein 39